MKLLLSKSGYQLEALPGNMPLDLMVKNMVLDVVNHELTFDELVDWFHERISKA